MKVLPNMSIIRQPQFQVRVVYKSGYSHDFWCNSFTRKGDTYTWDAVDVDNRPLNIGVDDIAAVYQIGSRRVFKIMRG